MNIIQPEIDSFAIRAMHLKYRDRQKARFLVDHNLVSYTSGMNLDTIFSIKTKPLNQKLLIQKQSTIYGLHTLQLKALTGGRQASVDRRCIVLSSGTYRLSALSATFLESLSLWILKWSCRISLLLYCESDPRKWSIWKRTPKSDQVSSHIR